jgi:membrane protein YqaA with SNARE-associated domain
VPPDLSEWSRLAIFSISVVYGYGSGLFPLLNAEAFVVAAQASPRTAGAALAIALAVGQTGGKVTLFLLSRKGRSVAFARRRRARALPVPPVPRRRFTRLLASLLRLVGSRRWGIPIVLMSAFLGLPPIYAVAILAGASRMRLWWFAPIVLFGRIVRFVLLAIGIYAGFSHWFP